MCFIICIEIHAYNLVQNKYTRIRHKAQKLLECEIKSLERSLPQTMVAPCRSTRWPPEGAMGAKWRTWCPLTLLSLPPDCYSPTLSDLTTQEPSGVFPIHFPTATLGFLSEGFLWGQHTYGDQHSKQFLLPCRLGERTDASDG